MIISRAPYRVSFFGGGTDYPAYYHDKPGAVLSSTIDKYCYVTCRIRPPFFQHKYSISYSRVELANELNEIMHPSVRECIRSSFVQESLEIKHDGDLPARTGIGSSSAFTVALLNALFAIRGVQPSARLLAEKAITVEQGWIGEAVGSQDQTAIAYGGFNLITFFGDQIEVIPVASDNLSRLESHLLLLFTGFEHDGPGMARRWIDNTVRNAEYLAIMYNQVAVALDILHKGQLEAFGELLHDGWMLKRRLADGVTNHYIDWLYNEARDEGAIGGKLLGAGGGGFMLLLARPDKHEAIIKRLGLLHVPFHFESKGAQILFNSDS